MLTLRVSESFTSNLGKVGISNKSKEEINDPKPEDNHVVN